MSFSMQASTFQKHEIEEQAEFQPAPKGQYRCELSNCQLLDRISQAGHSLTDFKAELVVFMPDQTTKKVWINFFVAHSKETAKGLAQKNENQLFDLYINVVGAKFGGDNSQFNNITPSSIYMMDGAIVELGLDIDKKNPKFNEVVEFNPAPQQAPMQQAPMQQAPMQQAPQTQPQAMPPFMQNQPQS